MGEPRVDPERVQRAAEALSALMEDSDDDHPSWEQWVTIGLDASGYPADLARALDALEAVIARWRFADYTPTAVEHARTVLADLRGAEQ